MLPMVVRLIPALLMVEARTVPVNLPEVNLKSYSRMMIMTKAADPELHSLLFRFHPVWLVLCP